MRDPDTFADQKRRAKTERQKRYRRNHNRGTEVCPVPVTKLLRKYLSAIRWTEPAALDNLSPQERRRAIGEAIGDGLSEAASAYFEEKHSAFLRKV